MKQLMKQLEEQRKYNEAKFGRLEVAVRNLDPSAALSSTASVCSKPSSYLALDFS